MYRTVYEQLSACIRPEAIAIEGVGKTPLTYSGLKAQVDNTINDLHRLGYGTGSRIAVMLPNGAVSAVAVLSVAAGFTCAPLNPAYTHQELEFYLRDMKADTIIVPHEEDPATVSFLRSKGIFIIFLKSDDVMSGVFELSGEKRESMQGKSLPGPEDIAMLLHTSGTTARPKLVPIRQSSVIESVFNVIAPLKLTENDKCLNVTPMFHVHGLLGTVLTSLVSGGRVVCAPGFQPEGFIDLLKEYRPTWYSAAPAVQRHILLQASMRPGEARSACLRFIRSTSASLPSDVREGLEAVFGIPVIEGYGLTESPHQITTNPMPPLTRKPGSAGLPVAGLEVAIIDEEWNVLPQGIVGEIVIKGPRIMRAYENDPEANAYSFKDGWFRTGDLGYLDEDGFLFFAGRIKEIINKSGEKVSPMEVEDALVSYPGVLEAVVFMIPDPSLGENVGAAIVVEREKKVSVDEIKRYVSGRLAYFKVPAKLWIVDSIPKGPTGKLQRVGMYEWLKAGLETPSSTPSYEPPSTTTESVLAGIWAEVLGVDRVGRHDSFFDMGGDSLRATMVASRISRALNAKVGIAVIMDRDTISKLGDFIDSR